MAIFATLLGLPAMLLAQGAGSIAGTAINNDTAKALSSAEISVKGTSFTTLTNPDGSFRINGVPAGSYTVVASYAGLEDQEKPVTVAADAVASVEFGLSSGEVITLDAVKVAGVKEGNAYAVQQQRTSETARMVVSADAFGIVSDANPGEFLKSMPGMTMDYTGIEPRRVSVRGLEPNLVQVLLNGNQVANAASTSLNRAFEFDHTSIDSVEAMDVSLASRPDMPANSIGGTINIITRSAFMQKGRRISGTINVTTNDQHLTLGKTSGPSDKRTIKTVPGFSFVFSDTFMDGRLGVAFSASVTQVYGLGQTAYNNFAYTSAPSLASGINYHENNTVGYVSQYRREDHTNFNARAGSSLNLDFKLNDSTTLFLRSLFTDFYYEFRNRFIVYNPGAIGTLVGTPTFERVQTGATTANTQQNMSFGNKYGRSTTVNIGAKHEFGNWKINYDGWFSKATAHYRYPDYFGGVTIQKSNVGFLLEKNPGTAVANITQNPANSSSIWDLSGYAPSGTVSTNARDGRDMFTGAKASAKRDFEFSFPFSLESGLFYQKQQRLSHSHSRSWTWNVGGRDMREFAEDYTPDIGFGQPHNTPNFWVSPYKLKTFADANPGLFVENEVTTFRNTVLNDRKGNETITAAYLQSTVKFGKFDILAGARIENTKVKAEGPVTVGTGGSAPIIRVAYFNDYTPPALKDIHLKYNATKKIQGRLSYTEAFGRADIGDMIPSNTINDTTKVLSISNTSLKPQRSENIDAAVEYYIKGTNYVSAGWFKKNIKDYILLNTNFITAPNPLLGIGPEYADGSWRLTTRSNVATVRIEGYELSGRYALPFIPKVVGELEIWGNYTQLYKTEGQLDPVNPSRVYTELLNIPPWFWNAGFTYRGLDGKLRVNVKCNFNADKTTSIAQTHDQVNDRLVTDGDISYKFAKHWDISLAMRNILSVDEGTTQGERTNRTGNGGGRAMTFTLKATY